MLIVVLLVLAALCNALLLVYTAISLGQLASLHKIRAAIGIGIGLAFLEQIIVTVIIMHIPERWFSVRVTDAHQSFEQIREAITKTTQAGLWLSIGIFSIFAVIYYVILSLIHI